MSIRRHPFAWLIILLIAMYAVIISQRYIIGLVACAFIYLDIWLIEQIDQESGVRSVFGTFQTAIMGVLMIAIVSYSVIFLYQLEFGIVAAAIIFLIALVTEAEMPFSNQSS